MSQAQMTKDRWIELFQAVGMDADAMQRWHRTFESGRRHRLSARLP